MKPHIPNLSNLPGIPGVKISPRSLWEEFKNFAFKGNMIELAIAVVIGGAFGAVVNSLVTDIVMPAVSHLFPRNVDYTKWHWGHDEKPVKYGVFLGQLVNFFIVAITVFIVMVKFLGALIRKANLAAPLAAPTTRECPMCLMPIPIKARKCGHCTSDLNDEAPR